MFATAPREPLNKSRWRDGGFAGWDARKATTRMVRPRRAEQYLPKEDATPQRDARPQSIHNRGRCIPLRCPIPLRGPLVQRSGGAPFARSLTRQTACKARPIRVAVKSGAHGVALLGIVVPATTSVARLMIIPILTATRSARICSAVP